MFLPTEQSQDISRRFGNAVKQQRTNLAISQEELAERTGLHRTYISDVERATRNVTLKTAAKLADALGVSICILLESSIESE